MDDKIAQLVKLMFETCEAELCVFLALFGHEIKLVTGEAERFRYKI
jgi:hypothetical protein